MRTLLKIAMALGAAVMMAEVEKSVQKPTDAGAVVSLNSGLSTSDEYLFDNDGKTLFVVDNGGAEATDVTIVTPEESGGLAVEDRKVTVAAGTKKVIGPFKKSRYNNKKGKIKIKLSKVTTVTVAAYSTANG